MNAAAALLLVLSLQVPRDQASTAKPAAAPSGTASISGTVIAADDSHPLALANVVLIGAMTGTLKLTSTDRNGQFVFTKLAADRYVVGASKPPYVGTVAGARRPGRQGTPIVVLNGQTVTGLAVALPRGAAISGTIYDERGSPARATVILRQWKMLGDERVLISPPIMSNVDTDDTGRFRFYGVPAGEYVVGALRSQGTGFHALTDSEYDLAMSGRPVDLSIDTTLRSTMFYAPNTARPQDAATVVVASGEERGNVDVGVGFVRAARVEGIVVGPNGQPIGGRVSVRMGTPSSPAGTATLSTVSVALTRPDGRFEFGSSVPGPQVLTVVVGAGADALVASTSFDTSLGDQVGLQLTLRPPMSIAGTLMFDGTPAPDTAGRTIVLKPLGRTFEFSTTTEVTQTTADGSFKINRILPGRYLIGGPMSFGASSASVIWALKSVVVDGKDFTDRPIDVSADAPPTAVVVTYTNQWQQLTGKLSQSSGGIATDETMIVFPAERAFWYQGSRRIAVTRPASDGLFSFGGQGPTTLPPGDYLLAAVTDLGRDEQFDPSFLATLVAAAAPITIWPGEKKTQDLVIR